VRRATGSLYDLLRFQGGIAWAERELLRTDRAPRETLDALGRERVLALLRHALAHVPHYRGAVPQGATTLDGLPLLSKENLTSDLLARDRPRRARVRRTSGSTGRPTSVVVDVVSLARHRAARRAGWRRFGVSPGDRWGMVWGRDEPRGRLHRAVVEFAENRRLLRVEELDGGTGAAALARFRPALLYGFASALARLAEQWGAGGAPKAVVATAEMLPAAARERMARAFGAPVVLEYGLTEAQVVATACEAGSLHVVEENVRVEILVDGRAAAPGETGDIVVTDLFGRAAPLLRYRTGDAGAFVAGDCPCGRAHRRLDLRLARACDLFEIDGRAFHPEVFTPPHALPCYDEIRQFRVSRVAERSFEVEVLWRPGARPDAAREYEASIRASLPVAGLALAVRPVDRLERDPSGKLSYFRDARGRAS
jgi:phenylacetate-CoA ligase